MLSIENETSLSIDFSLLEKICDFLSEKEVELVFVNDETIHEINKEHRNVDKATDVLSFPLEPMPYAPLGTIVISVDTAQKVATFLGHSLDEEIALLFIHGLLHLKGFDHEVDDGQMRQEEESLIEKFKLPKSLIVRTLQ